MSQQQVERQFEYRPQRKTMKTVGILLLILPLVGLPVLLSNGVEPAELLGYTLSAPMSAALYIGMGLVCFLCGASFLAGALRKIKSLTEVRLTADRIIFPDIKTGENARAVAYSDIKSALVESRGSGKRLRIVHAGGESLLDSADMESLASFTALNDALQQQLSAR